MRTLTFLTAITLTAACGPSSGNTGSTDATGSSSAGSSGESGESAGESTETGGTPNCGELSCTSDQWCNWTGNTCGTEKWDEPRCDPRPDECPDVVAPVCACGAETYDNECEAQMAGVDIAESNECIVPPGQFPCGPRFCNSGFEYCRLGVSDVGSEPNTWECVANPDCPAVDCASCLSNEPCGEICEVVPGGFQVTCPGG